MARQILHIVFLILFGFTSFTARGQTSDRKLYHDLAKPYRNLKQNSKNNNPKIKFLDGDSIYENCGIELMQIMIIRHQEVNIKKQSSYTYIEANAYLEAYDTAQIFPVVYGPVELRANEIDSLYCSTLSRSKCTAQQLFRDTIPIQSHDIFREYKKSLPTLPLIHLPIIGWKSLSTPLWVLDLENQSSESYRTGKLRARQSAEFVQSRANSKGKVILVGHGFINHHIKKQLKKMGWKMIINGKSKNLGVTLLVKFR